VSGARLLPMVLSLLPLIRAPHTRNRDLIVPAQLTAVSMWIESQRLLPSLPRDTRIPFSIGLGIGFMTAAHVGTLIGYHLATSFPPLLTAALLFLTPISFLISTVRNCRLISDWLSLVFGLLVAPLLVWWNVGLDLIWTGIIGGSLAYAFHRLGRAVK
jgi:predicted branched-subunit amino acid permease